jgi:flagellar biosynthetic protein FliQ
MAGSDMVDLLREAMLTAGLAAAPVLLVGLLVGLVLGILQAATGVQEQTLGQLPRLVAMASVLALTLPWMLETFVGLLRTSALWP